ncbi:phosphoribosylglycinamide formyltransferase [bacterium BMS3Bbin02]|nr:phosphoribosylglycinamide formyltransferase [bacterium BMS3Bbin02]
MSVGTTERTRIAVLVSGSGSNLQALIDASLDPDFGAEIAVVIADRPHVSALDRAAAQDIDHVVVAWSDFFDRAAFTAAICDVARRYEVAGLVLAGFMRILARGAIEQYPDAIINVHPALLPAFPGADAVGRALAHGVTVTGVTVHFVDEQVDHGPIILQEAVAVRSGDTVAVLHGRIQKIEHRVFPRVVDAFGKGLLRVEGRRVEWTS